MHYIKRSTWPLLLFCVVFLVQAGTGVFISGDSRFSIHTAMSIIREGNTDLNEYELLLAEHDDYLTETIDGHHYTIFPIGVSVLAVPFIAMLNPITEQVLGIDIHQYISHAIPGRFEGFIASFIIALTAVVMFLIARRTLSNRYAVAVAFLFAFGTPAWSTASRALWQHGPSMLCLALALYLLLLAREKPWLSQFASLPLAWAYVVRPTNSIAIVVFTLYVLVYHRRDFLRYAAWSTVVAIPFLLFNVQVYHNILSPYYLPQRLGSSPSFWEALAGNLISPARGLFMFTPIFVMSLPGMWLYLRERQTRGLAVSLISIVVLHWLVISSFPHWWAGHSYGPRFFSDMTPFLVYFLVPVVAVIDQRTSRRSSLLLSVAVCLSFISVFIHARGALTYDTWNWNSIPANIDQHPSRVWDWSDPPFLRGVWSRQ